MLNKSEFSEVLNAKLQELENTPQNTKFHPEGNVLNHTAIVFYNAYNYIKLNDVKLTTDQSTAFLLTALFHDFGKPETLDYNKYNQPTAHGHEKVSVKWIRKYKSEILDFFKVSEKSIDIMIAMVFNHMRVKQIDVMREFKVEKLKNDLKDNFALLVDFSNKCDASVIDLGIKEFVEKNQQTLNTGLKHFINSHKFQP